MIEEWREVVGAKKYLVSSQGRVRKATSTGLDAYLVAGVRNKRIGHLSVTLHEDDGSRKSRAVHRLVCQAFNPPEPFENAKVVFLDGDNRNFHPENLEWETASSAIVITKTRGRDCD